MHDADDNQESFGRIAKKAAVKASELGLSDESVEVAARVSELIHTDDSGSFTTTGETAAALAIDAASSNTDSAEIASAVGISERKLASARRKTPRMSRIVAERVVRENVVEERGGD